MNAGDEIILGEACDWIARLQGRKPDADGRRELHDWMARSESHRQTIQHLAQEWDAMNVLTELAVPHPSQGSSQTNTGGSGRSLLSSRSWWAGWSAGVCTLVIAALVWMPGLTEQPGNALQEIYSTPRGVQERIALPDGSMAVLNSGSRLSVDYSRTSRQVQLLRGEAHFEVEKDHQRPFTVQAGRAVFSAVGTAFAVRFQNEQVEITVVEGKVKFAETDAPATDHRKPRRHGAADELLGVGDRLVVSEKEGSVIERGNVSTQEMTRKLAWRDGKVIFRGETMAEVVAELSRHTDTPIVIDGKGVESLRVGGAFDIGETRKFLNSLQVSFGLQIRYEDDAVYISSPSES